MDLFEKVNKQLGYGIMAPPFIDNETVDIQKFQQIVDYLIPRGYNYFETGRTYMDGACEKAFKQCISSRYPRDAYAISNKLSPQNLYNIEETFESQLITCGVDYFDVYLMHGQDRMDYIAYRKAGAYDKILEYKRQGKIKHFGISFHDDAETLEYILKNEPEIEIVQIQFNYFDYEDDIIQSKLLYEVCCKYNKKIVVMKPNRGPLLSHLPNSVRNIVQCVNYNNYSDASYSFRFVREFQNIWMILTCVRSVEEAIDNVNTMENLPHLNAEEKEMLYKITMVLRNNMGIPCVKCGYCITYCPLKNNIPDIIDIMNLRREYYKIDDEIFFNQVNFNINCIKCGQCTRICPQKIPVMELINTFQQNIESTDNKRTL